MIWSNPVLRQVFIPILRHINVEGLIVIESLRNLSICVSILKTSIRHRDPCQSKLSNRSICQHPLVYSTQKLNMAANLPCSHCHINAEVLVVIESLRNLSIYISILKTSIRHRDPCQNNRLTSVALKAAKPRASRSFRCCMSILPRPTRSPVKIPLLARELSLSRHKS
jgi:hypothetical protein